MLDTIAMLEGMLRDSGGVEVCGTGEPTWGHLDAIDEVVLQEAGVQGVAITLTVATGSLPGVRQDSELTVDGTAYTVRLAQRIDDGALTRLLLREA